MKKPLIKLIISTFLALTFLITSTYAWYFTNGNVATADGINMSIENEEDGNIAIDNSGEGDFDSRLFPERPLKLDLVAIEPFASFKIIISESKPTETNFANYFAVNNRYLYGEYIQEYSKYNIEYSYDVCKVNDTIASQAAFLYNFLLNNNLVDFINITLQYDETKSMEMNLHVPDDDDPSTYFETTEDINISQNEKFSLTFKLSSTDKDGNQKRPIYVQDEDITYYANNFNCFLLSSFHIKFITNATPQEETENEG